MQTTFWPRPSASPGPLDHEVFCEYCGYNLRGLAENRCPECGKEFAPHAPSGSQLPWNQRRAIGRGEAYARTVWRILRRPQAFAEEVWYSGRLSVRAARLFRLVTVAIAFVSLMIVALTVVAPHLPPQRFWPMAIGGGVLLLIWLERSTRLIVRFCDKQIMRFDVQQRCLALGHMSCAALALSPLHVLLAAALGLATRFDTTGGVVPGGVAIAWAVFAAAQLGLWLSSVLTLINSAMRCSEGELVGVGLLFIMVWAGHACWFLLIFPLILHTVAADMLHLY
jgi:hypothetical protein